MLDLREYRTVARARRWLPWAGLVAPGVILNKDGRAPAQRALSRPRPRLLHTSRADRGVGPRQQRPEALGSGLGAVHEAQRRPSAHYPAATFPIRCPGWSTRNAAPVRGVRAAHFESEHVLTFCYPAAAGARRARQSHALRLGRQGDVDWRDVLEAFVARATASSACCSP